MSAASSPPSSDPGGVFSLRIVSLDYYMSSPIPDIDFCYNASQGGKVNEVPVIRIFGATPAGQKACLHIHRALPYLYVPFPDSLLQSPEEGQSYLYVFSRALEKALTAMGNPGHCSALQCLHHNPNFLDSPVVLLYMVHGTVFQGKLTRYYPHEVARAASLLLGGDILDRIFQPYESHIPYLLQVLVDHNLYGMGHVHISAFKFRPPLPDSYISKEAHYKEDNMLAGTSAAALDSPAIWLSSSIQNASFWPDPAAGNEDLGNKFIKLLRRQSICALELDSTVDDIINEKYKSYTPISQSRADVKMVQSLVPIWEEEYERSGMQEAVVSHDAGKPLPENVLRSFTHGLTYDNALSELCLEVERSFPPAVSIETEKKSDNCIRSFADLGEVPTESSRFSSLYGDPGGQKYIFQSPSMLSEGHAIHSKKCDFHELASLGKHTSMLEAVGTEDSKGTNTQALGLLSWFASSQAAEGMHSDDELLHDAILSPSLPIESYQNALEIVHMDYESASQQECQDILDSIGVYMSDGHENGNGGSSGNMIPQIDGSSDDKLRTPKKCDYSGISLDNRLEKSSMHLLRKCTSKKHRKYREKNILWGPLPLSVQQKDNADANDAESSSSSGNKDVDQDASKVDADVETYTQKGEDMTGCSVRDLMRRKRSFLTKQSEPERHVTAMVPEGQKDENAIHFGEEPEHPSLGSENFENPQSRACLINHDCVGQESMTCTTWCTQVASKGHCLGPSEPLLQSNELSTRSLNIVTTEEDDRLRVLFPKCLSADDCLMVNRSFASNTSLLCADHVILHESRNCVSKLDSSKNQELFTNAHFEGLKDSDCQFNVNTKNIINRELKIGMSSSNHEHRKCSFTPNEESPIEYMEKAFSMKPPSRDAVRAIVDDPVQASGVVESTDVGEGVSGFLPFFSKSAQDKGSFKLPLNKNYNLSRRAALGVPSHFQNDGSVLYLLTHAISPPSSTSVCQWLSEAEQQNFYYDCIGAYKERTPSLPFPSDPHPDYSNSLEATGHECSEGPGFNATVDLKIKRFTLTNENCTFPQTENHPSQASTDSSEPQVVGLSAKGKLVFNTWRDISQISGPDAKSNLTPLSQTGFRDPASVGGGRQLTLISMEVLAESRGDLRPDPQFDAINVISLAIQEEATLDIEFYVLMRSCNDETCSSKNVDGISGCQFVLVSEEKLLLDHFVKVVSSFDPDILMGWEIQGSSLGFLAERAAHLGIDLLKKISRTPQFEPKNIRDPVPESHRADDESSMPEAVLEATIIEDEWGRTHDSGIHVGGRIVLNVWRLMRAEVKLNMYTVEAVAEEVLRRKIPSISCRVLNNWFSSGSSRARFRCIEYFIVRAELNIQIMDQLDMVSRTSELARIFGIDFFSVLSRGSQFRVESMLLRLAHTQNYLAISPGSQQVASQPAMECLPLVMEPESNFYVDPVVVLDFQSLYPSMIIAYNLCFSTCLGKVIPSKANVLGVSSYAPDLQILKDLKEELLLTPNGVMYVPSKVREGVLPRLLEEILSTRIMVKQAMKRLMPSQKVLQRIFNARQLALKLISNVTYGYTAAGFSGRMPCAELADSIVQCGRRTLETAISFVNEHDKWKGRVIYGDTDSMFVLLKGRSLEEAFRIGHEIASSITAISPHPVTLKMEKVYHPCFLLTKKRYVGYSYESPNQDKPVFDAKGIETVRRDTCRAVAKTLEQSLRLIFEHRDVSKVKSYLQRQWTRIITGKVSLQDFVFAKEVRLGTYSTNAFSLPPAAIVATKAMRVDPRAVPCYGERVPYVVINGEPGARLVDMVVDPSELLDINSPYRLNDLYYIRKQIIPALQRVFGLVGADLNQWFLEMPRPVRPTLAKCHTSMSHSGSSHDTDSRRLGFSRKAQAKRSRIDTYYASRHCTLCGELIQVSTFLCDKCSEKQAVAAAVVVGRTSRLEKELQHLTAICRHCGGGDWIVESGVKCTSLACSIFYERRKVQKELQTHSSFAMEAGYYPRCIVEWF